MDSYKLADGSTSDLYQVGDEFFYLGPTRYSKGSIVSLCHKDNPQRPLVNLVKGGSLLKTEGEISWQLIKPTSETMEKVKARKANKPFTKADLKDGMRCIDRDGDTCYVCGGFMVGEFMVYVGDNMMTHANSADDLLDDLTSSRGNCCDIMQVIDRDGTVVFERKEPPIEKLKLSTKQP